MQWTVLTLHALVMEILHTLDCSVSGSLIDSSDTQEGLCHMVLLVNIAKVTYVHSSPVAILNLCHVGLAETTQEHIA